MPVTVPETDAWMWEAPRSFSRAIIWPTVTWSPTWTMGSDMVAWWAFIGESGISTSLGMGIRTAAMPAVLL